MPIYEFVCPGCGLIEEIRTPVFSSSLHCAKCDLAMIKKISVVNNTFGWRLSKESHDVFLRKVKQGGKDELVRNV